MGINFIVVSPDVTEDVFPGEAPSETVRRLARRKATAGAQRHPDAIVLGADTIVGLDDTILGKPADAGEAARMLKQLRGTSHTVYSGVAVAAGQQVWDD